VCAGYSCSSSKVEDATACDLTVVSDYCGFYLPVYCSGQAEQASPECPDSCAEDGECDPDAHCDGTCEVDLAPGQPCDEDSDCISQSCMGGQCT